ncbi:MAG TPA: hypothetical protein VGJ44_19335 [Kribbellaceae bacterium]|jgi:hypothetical protein
MSEQQPPTPKVLAGLAALLIGFMAACTSGGSDKPAQSEKTTSASVSPVASPTAAITREAAGKQYLAIIGPSNAKGDKCLEISRFYDNNITDANRAKLTICYGELGKLEREATAKLRTAQWPDEVTADVENVARSIDASAYAHEQAAKAKTDQELFEVQFPKDDGSADIVRARLGLPTRK